MKNCSFLIIFVVMLCSSCSAKMYVDGPTTTRSYPLAYYNDIIIDAPFDVYITDKPSNTVDVITNESVQKHINVHVSGSTLYISLSRVSFNEQIEVSVNIPNNRISYLELGGTAALKVMNGISVFDSRSNTSLVVNGASYFSGRIDGIETNVEAHGNSFVEGYIKADYTTYMATGKSQISLEQTTNQATALEANGASSITVRGLTRKLEAQLSGGSNLFMKVFDANLCNIYMEGNSYAEIGVGQTLEPHLYGASTLKVWGNPRIFNDIIAGGSTLTNMGL